MSAVHDVLAELKKQFDQHRIRWYVFGAQAVVVYGLPRQTADIDVTVETPVESAEKLASSLSESGFTILTDDVKALASRARIIPISHVDTGIPIDIILAGPGLEQEFMDRSIAIELGDISVPFISPEDLVAIKLLAGRWKDIEDVRGIIERRADLNHGQITDLLARMEAALDRSDLIQLYVELGGAA